MPSKFQIVTGAPGAGKTATVQALLNGHVDTIVFDIDWLADSASELAQRSIYRDASTWNAYPKLWLDILQSISINHKQALLFAPMSEKDIEGLIDKTTINWLLLDCSYDERIPRLEQRHWSQDKIQEALSDTKELRQDIPNVIDTSNQTPKEVAKQVIKKPI